jgi:hypothetical protein
MPHCLKRLLSITLCTVVTLAMGSAAHLREPPERLVAEENDRYVRRKPTTGR